MKRRAGEERGRDESKRRRAESQWIVAARHSATYNTRRGTGSSPEGRPSNELWGPGPLLQVAIGRRAQAHNPAHGSFAPLAFQPSAMTNCANQRIDRHAFTVRIRTGNQNQTSFYPFVPHEISVLVELILGHCMCAPANPTDNVSAGSAASGLGSKRGAMPLRFTEYGISISPRGSLILHSQVISQVGLESAQQGLLSRDSASRSLAVVSLDIGFPCRTSSELNVRCRGRPEGTFRSSPAARGGRSRAGAARAVRRQPTGSGGTPCRSQSQSFPEVTDPFCDFLATLFIDQRLFTWRLMRARGRTGTGDVRCSSSAGPTPVSRFQGGQAVKQKDNLPRPATSARRAVGRASRLLGSTNPCASAFTWNFPLRLQVSFEYLLLPRSAPTAVRRARAQVLRRPAPPTHRGWRLPDGRV
ncbi:hypothetical protein DVH24_031519 [Malus domestica]|uniref:Senescence-associated protein n=1 Tax=Malus domestica TaxID=3750 RepID=A0A498KVX8_MALDO|nr:hypothetical protein DVH24_031519 [Malus domestica]